MKLPELVDPPQNDDSDIDSLLQPQTEKKDIMESIVKCKHPLSKWLEFSPKHQRDLIDFNGVIQSESRRKTLPKRWRDEAMEKRMTFGDIEDMMLEMEEREAMKTDDQKEQDRKRIVAHVKVSCLESSKHQQLQKYMNSMQNDSDDIFEINMAEKANWESSVDKKKWKVIGLINPDVHLSTLDHSLNVISMPLDSHSISILNYHHWIPTVFGVNSKGMDSPRLFCLFPLSFLHHSTEQTFEL